MAYLTKYNLGQLCQKLKINVEITLEMFLKHIYNDTEMYTLLNKRELEYLFKYKMLLDDEEKFVVEYYSEVPEKEDTKNFVFNKGGKMKYHLSSECKLITKDYLDFKIPEEIKDIGNEAIEEYRSWFNSNGFGDKFRNKTIDKSAIAFAFNLKYPAKYNISPIEDNSNILVIEQPNSTSERIEQSYDFEQIKKELELLKNQWQTAFPCRITRIIAKFKHLLNQTDEEINEKISNLFSSVFIKNYGLDKLKQKFKISKDITTKIIALLLEHIKWTYKLEDKNFDNKTLEKFGLECCLSCMKEFKG